MVRELKVLQPKGATEKQVGGISVLGRTLVFVETHTQKYNL